MSHTTRKEFKREWDSDRKASRAMKFSQTRKNRKSKGRQLKDLLHNMNEDE